MDNKTIVNGIDVSECSYYNKDNEPYCCEIWDNECEAQNCYFKQCKRLQKENEELKNKIESYNCNANCYKYKEANKYKQALEEIREIAKEFLKDLCDDCAWHNTDECNPEGYNCGEMNKIINKIGEVIK